jgi:pimeloyl-ACP methyl ester carboxylesterase
MQQRHFRWYGEQSGRPVVYFHGAPGAAIECGRFHEAAQRHGVRLVGLERSSTDIRLTGETYFERHANEVAALAGDGPFEAIGFSIGAFVALRTAPYLRGRLTRLHLVSAPAPLESGDFLKTMAGKALFRMAKRSPDMFRRLAKVEAWLALNAAPVLFSMLFASASGADRALAADPAFRAEIDCVLKLGLGAGSTSFMRDVREYVRPWAERLAQVTVDTRIWHGAQDNWSPPAMADALKRLIPGASAKTVLPGLSHYSCLFEAVPRILAEPAA